MHIHLSIFIDPSCKDLYVYRRKNKQIKLKNDFKFQACNFPPYPLKCIYVIVLII